jgi:hypothetical protein
MFLRVRHTTFVILFMTSFLSAQSNITDITYVRFKGAFIDVKYSKEGLLCSGIYKNNYKVDFINVKKLNRVKLEALNQFILNSSIWLMDSSYVNQDVIIGGSWCTFIFTKDPDDQYKRVFNSNCYQPVLDNLIILLHEIIPQNKRKYYNLEKYRFNTSLGTCISK